MKIIVANVIGFCAFIYSLLAYHKKTKNKIFQNMIISNFLNLVHYILLGAYSGGITKILAILRDTIIIKKEKYTKLLSNFVLGIFLIIYIISGIFTYTNIWSIFCILAAVIYIIKVWNGDEKTVKETAFFCYFLWLIYNVSVYSVAGIVSNVVSIISTFIAMKNTEK